MHPMLNIAVRAARKAGNLIAKYYDISDHTNANHKVNIDFVNNVSKSAEDIIITTIHKFYPHHTIITKGVIEQKGTNKDIQWIIDPIDSTINFVKCFPHFSVSIAVRIKNRTEITVIYDPIRNELFTVSRGQGTRLNGHRIRSSNVRNLEGTILAIDFSFKIQKNVTTYTNILSKLFSENTDFRRTKSVALDLAYVAAGRIDGYLAIGLNPWNFAAGDLIVREAGALVCDFNGNHNYAVTGNIIAGNPHIVKAILSNICNELDERN